MTISQLFVESSVAEHDITKRFASRLNLTPVVVKDPSTVFQSIKEAQDPWTTGKQTLLLTRNQGPFFKKCPGTKEYRCCDYTILHIGSYCTMDCAYCILQSYFHPPILQYFINEEDCISEVRRTLSESKCLRVGTGEFSDSLIWESWSDLTPRLIDLFAQQNQSVLELKTKTTTVQFLAGLPHRRKTILAWSLNTPHIIATQERRTSPLPARLQAAALCQKWGYPLAFHFDPLVLYPGCEQAYHDVIQALFSKVSPENIVWISLGSFRFMSNLKTIVQHRFPQSDIVYGEFVSGLDKKMRYFKPLRIKLYRLMAQWIAAYAPKTTVYLCMEDDSVWTQAMGFNPMEKGGLPAMLDQSAKKVCGLAP